MPFDTLALVCFGVFLAALIVLVNAHRARAYSARMLLRVGCAVVMLGAVGGLIVDSVPPPLTPVNVPANVPASLSILATVGSGSPEAGLTVESLRGSDGSVRWQTSLPGGGHYVMLAQSLLVAVPQAVGSGADLDVLALDPATGQQVWHTSLPGLTVGQVSDRVLMPAVSGRYIFIAAPDNVPGSGRSQVFALDSTDGHLDWHVVVTDFGGGLVADAGFLYYITQDGALAALRQPDGSLAWRSAPGDYEGMLAAGGGQIFASFRSYVAQEQVYSFGVAVFRATDGSPLWRYGGTAQLALYGPTFSLSNDQLYVAATPGTPNGGQRPAQVYAFASVTGALAWHTEVGAFTPGQLAVPNGSAVYVSGGASLYALAAATGKVLWRHTGNANAGYETAVVTPTTLFTISQVIYPHYIVSCPPACEPVPGLTAFNAASGSIYWRKAPADIAALTLVGASG
jgi:outer membrane protein assembly factor BamB